MSLEAGVFAGAMSFENCWHPVMHASEPREVINVRTCELCKGEFLPDIGQQKYCGREICRQVRMFWAKEKRHLRGGNFD